VGYNTEEETTPPFLTDTVHDDHQESLLIRIALFFSDPKQSTVPVSLKPVSIRIPTPS
jgi:hypothetical protein